MKIAISAESTIDLQRDLLTRYDISVLPYKIVLGDDIRTDGEVRGSDIFAYTEKTGLLAKTTALNESEFTEFFQGLLQKYDAVIHFVLSSAMSSTYEHALAAAKKLRKVYVIDSKELSTGIALEAIYARKLANAGKNPEEIIGLVEKRIPYVQASFSLERVDYLYKGGRCSALKMLGANVLHLKPEILVKDGKMVSGKKDHGPMEKATMEYVANTLKAFHNPDLEEVFITFSSPYEEMDINTLVDQIHVLLRKRGFKNVHVTQANGTVCCHCGPHTLGILYFNDGPHAI
jgi:DegV family protein with EDD domain